MTTARLNGVELAYDVRGDEEPVVLVGGTGMPPEGWRYAQQRAGVEELLTSFLARM